ncbi:MAG: hypothetical protein QOD00_1686 [Blastocatellia bacterium]|jgi:hypothetical protein|nr:hypothetical protein [Blastocatellia bacterium]
MTREEARKIQLQKIDEERKAIMARFDKTVAEINEKKAAAQPVQPTTKPRTFEVDGEQIPYESEKCNDTTVSNAWNAIVDANR